MNQLSGEALSPYAHGVVIGNKVGAWRSPDGGWTTDHRPEVIRSQVEDAARDLRADVSRLTYLRLGGDGQAPAVPIAAVENRYNLVDRSGVEVLAGCERRSA